MFLGGAGDGAARGRHLYLYISHLRETEGKKRATDHLGLNCFKRTVNCKHRRRMVVPWERGRNRKQKKASTAEPGFISLQTHNEKYESRIDRGLLGANLFPGG